MTDIKVIHHSPGSVLLMRSITRTFHDDGTSEISGELIEEMTAAQARDLAEQILSECIKAEIDEARFAESAIKT